MTFGCERTQSSIHFHSLLVVHMKLLVPTEDIVLVADNTQRFLRKRAEENYVMDGARKMTEKTRGLCGRLYFFNFAHDRRIGTKLFGTA